MAVNKAGENATSSWCLIPPIVWEDTKLNITEKCLLGRINALQDASGYCYASNEYLSKQLNKSTGTTANIIVGLVKKGYLGRIITFKEGSKKIDRRYLFMKKLIPLHENVNTPLHENVKDRIEVLEESVEESNNISIADKSAETNINNLIGLFEPVNPSYKTLYANKTQRSALQRLVKEHGEEKIERVINGLINVVTQPYAPKITTPLQLEQKLGELKIFLSQNVGSKKRGGVAYVG